MAKAKNKSEKLVQDNKYERARMLGSRALQISMGAPYLVKITKKEMEAIKYNPLEIAKKEMEKGRIPISVVRHNPKSDTVEK